MPTGVYARPSIEARLFARWRQNGACWEWTGAGNGQGYGVMGLDNKIRLVHRVSYEYFIGPIPDELEPDHLCRNPACFNPTHLEPVTHYVNVVERSFGRNFVAHRNGTCTRGHSRSESVLRRGTNLVVYCKACRRKDRKRDDG